MLAIVAKASVIALLMGALLGAWAWNALDEPRKSSILRQAKWLVLPGYAGLFLWVVVFAYGVFARGCDPAFGGWIRTPLFQGFIASEIRACSEIQLQARVKPELRAQFRHLPELWSQVYGHYDEVSGVMPDTGKVWIANIDNHVFHVPKTQLEFRVVPPRRGTPWWQPEEADESW